MQWEIATRKVKNIRLVLYERSNYLKTALSGESTAIHYTVVLVFHPNGFHTVYIYIYILYTLMYIRLYFILINSIPYVYTLYPYVSAAMRGEEQKRLCGVANMRANRPDCALNTTMHVAIDTLLDTTYYWQVQYILPPVLYIIIYHIGYGF